MSSHPEQRVAIPGSAREAVPGNAAGPVDANAEAEVTVVLRRRAPLPDTGGARPHLGVGDLAAGHGAGDADVALARQVLQGEVGLQVVWQDAPSRRLGVRGRLGDLQAAFGTTLERARSTDPATGREVVHRARSGELTVPARLAGVVVAVLGLDDRPQARPQFRLAPAGQGGPSYTPLDLARVYGFPAGTDGAGQTLAILELGGGYTERDLAAYFGGLGLATPAVRAVGVDGARNAPDGDPAGPDGEVLLDLEVAGALAPAADLVVYFAPNTDRGFLDALSTAVHATPTPTAVSISWGQNEEAWSVAARGAMDDAMADAAALGVTVTVAAGDDGSDDRVGDGAPHVDFPAASPYALGCGGTKLVADPASGRVRSEVVWQEAEHGATGGGISNAFPRPSWQRDVGVPGDAGRGVPDVAAVADPLTGYQVLVDGESTVIGGTSAVAPLWAALVCRLAQVLGRPLGLLQPALYSAAAPGQPVPGLRDITEGSNGAWSAGPGWDPCTGLGVPDGMALLAALSTPGVAPP